MKNIFYILSLILFVNSLKGQITNSEGNYSPANPNVSSLGKFIDVPVNHATGVPNISIPIHSLREGEVSLGVSLSYHGSGIKVATPSSSTGAGWAINAGGMVTRSIEGIADDLDNFAHDGVGWYHMDTIDFNYWKQGNPYHNSPRQHNIPDSMRIPWKRLNNGVVDNGPDIFSYITPNGFSGKFYFDENKEVVFIDNKHNLKIEFVTNGPFNTFSSIIITDNTGTKFTYGETAIEYTHGKSYELTHPVNYYIPKTWRLVKIENYNETDEINLTYENDYYGYFYANNSSRSITYSGARPEFCIPDFHSVPHEGLTGASDIPCMADGVHSTIKYTNSLAAYNQSLSKIYFANKKEYSVVLDKRLHKITTSDQEIEFSYQNTREDLTPYNVIPSLADSAQSLDEILIKNIDSVGSTTGCKKFKFAYSYFEDPTGDPNVTDDAKKRLKLNSLQEISCANPSVYIPPFVFDYHEQLLTGNISYFPNRLSKQIDHWGYHNGKQLNDWLNDPLNMPTVAVKDQHGDIVYNRESQVDRESDEASMLIGTLKSITYPTGGKTEFDFEANKAYREVPQLQVLTEFTADDNSDNNCTNGTSVQSYGFDTKNTYQNSLIDFYVEKTCTGITPSQNYNPAVATIEMLDQNNNVIATAQSVTSSAGKQYLYNGADINPLLSSFASNQVIRFKISVTGGVCGIRVYQRDTLINANAAVGGLRIKSTTLNEGTAPAVTTNYAYTTFNSSGYESSAVLLQDPYYGRAVTDYVVGTTDPHIQIVEIRERPFLPLSDIEGRTVVYTNVTQSNALGEVNYYVNSGDPISTYFSSFTAHLLPSKYDSKRGVTDSVLTFNASGVLVQKIVNHYNKHPMSSGTPNLSKMPFKHEPAPGAVKTADDTYLWWYNTYAFPRLIQPYTITANYTNLVKTISTTYNELGQEPITDIKSYTYDSYNNLKASYTWREIDGDATLNGEDHLLAENYYVYDGEGFPPGQTAVQTAIENKNMLGVPFKTTTKYQKGTSTPQIIGGSKTEMNFFNGGLLLAEKVYHVEGGSFYPTKLFDTYNNDGMPTLIKTYIVGNTISTSQLDNNHIEMVWNGNLLNSISTVSPLGTRTDYYTYNNRNLLETMVSYNGLETKFEYDELNRLRKMHKGKSVTETVFRGVTESNYHYALDINGNIIPGAKNEIVTTLTFAPEVSGSTLPQQISRKEFDRVGRLIQTQKDNFNPDGTDAIMSEVIYDNLGRVATQKALGVDPLVYNYETSPLSRVLSQTGPAGTASNSSGHNTSVITVGTDTYPVGTLSKATSTDVNGNKTTAYLDFLGKVIETKKEVTIQGNLQEVKTKYTYNNLRQLTKIIPPQGNSYEFTYNSRGWLKTNQQPNQIGPNKFYYDKWGRTIGSENPNGQILATKHDDLGRIVETGAITSFVNLDPTEHLVELPSAGLAEVHNIVTYKLNGSTPTEMVESESTVNMNSLQTTPIYYHNTFDYDAIGRLISIESENHKGGTEKVTNNYNNAGLVTQVINEHNTGNYTFGQQKTLDWDFQYDNSLRKTSRSLKIGSAASQLLEQFTYNNYNQLIRKDLHEVTPGNYWQNIDYTYDNAGRLIKINDLADVDNENCLADNYCDLAINLTCDIIDPTEGEGEEGSESPCETIIDSLFYVDSALGEIPVSAFSYPYTLNQANVNTFIADLKAWLDNNSFKYDQVVVSTNLDLITITQTNASLTKAVQAGQNHDAIISNCCGGPTEGDLFAQHILYPASGNTISSIEWATTCSGLSKYIYNYDELSRVTAANYLSSPNLAAGTWTPSDEYNMASSYDKLGNITSLTRNGLVNNNVVQIDDLTYNYNASNGRLSHITDGVGANYDNHGQKGNTAYAYDNNGNVLNDLSKDISIIYNEFNLPKIINKGSNNDAIGNVYLGDKKRIQKVSVVGTTGTVKDYIGGFEYSTENGVTKLDGFYYDLGRITFLNGQVQYEYSLRDHLGNNRVNFTDKNFDDVITKSDIIQENHFYPFGLALEGLGSHTVGTPNNYSYNGKEIDPELGLDWYDYGNRFYDPAVARWTSVDKLSAHPNQIDKAAYAYAWNNPISLTDPDGNCPKCPPNGGEGGSIPDEPLFEFEWPSAHKFFFGASVSIFGTLEGIYHIVTHPGQALEGLASTSVMVIAMGNPELMAEADAGLGTNSLLVNEAIWNGIEVTGENLVSGDAVKTGKSVTDVLQIVVPITLQYKTARAAALAEAEDIAQLEELLRASNRQSRRMEEIRKLYDEFLEEAGELDDLGDMSPYPFGDEVIAGYRISMEATLVDDIYKIRIPGLFAQKGAQTSLFSLIRQLEARAVSQGAKYIEINGITIVNNKLFNPSVAKRLGYMFLQSSENSIVLKKIL